MTNETLACPDCRSACEAEDNYCRNCGMFLAATRTLTVSRASVPAAARPGLPAPVRRAATAIAVGAALQVGVGLAGRYVARQAARNAAAVPARALGPRKGKAKPGRPGARPGAGLPEDVAAVNETLVIHRMWIRR